MGFKEDINGNNSHSYSKKDLTIDLEGFDFDDGVITWSHGGISRVEDVFEDKTYEYLEFKGMKLSLERYLKEKHEDFGKRQKDIDDVNIIRNIS